MVWRRIGLLLATAPLCGYLSCASITTLSEPERPAALGTEELRLARPGPLAYEVRRGVREGQYGRAVRYEVYRPENPGSPAMVFLAHGFLRDLASMRGWAAAWASHGVPAAVMSLPNSSWLRGRHERNAEDLRALVRAIHDGPALYAGFSAGGLAALLACSRDPSSIGYLGLDPVDWGGLAAPAASALVLPCLFLLGEPSSCNAEGNMLEALPPGPSAAVFVLRVRHAPHSYFEYPTDAWVARLCGSVRPEESVTVLRDTIRCLATAWVLAQSGVEPSAIDVLGEALTGAGAWSTRVLAPRGPRP